MSILTIERLEKRIENTLLFSAFDLECRKGETTAIYCNPELGNTLIRIILGELPSTSGLVHCLDRTLNRNQFFQRIGISLQSDALYERLTPKEYLCFFQRLYETDIDIDELLSKVGLIDKKDIRSGKLSFSEQKRLHFSRMILHHPDLLIFEEPTQNLDIESTMILHRLITSLEEQGKTIFFTTSNLENAISLTSIVYRLDESGLKKVAMAEEAEEAEVEEKPELIDEEPVPQEQDVENSFKINFDKIPAKVDDKLILFDPTEINYIESNNGVSHLNVLGETFPCSFTLSDLEKRLQPFGFFRCHRSYIVNLQKVREVITWTRNSYSLILDDKNKSSIPLSKGKLEELKTIIGI